MTFNNEKTIEKIDTVENEIMRCEQKIAQLRRVRNELLKIKDVSVYEERDDGERVKKMEKPQDRSTGKKIDDKRRNDIYDSMTKEADRLLNS